MQPRDHWQKRFLTESDEVLENYILKVKGGKRRPKSSIKDSTVKFLHTVEKMFSDTKISSSDETAYELNAEEFAKFRVSDEYKDVFRRIVDDLEAALDEIHELVKEEVLISTELEDRMESFIRNLNEQQEETKTKRPTSSDGPVMPKVSPNLN